MVGLSVVVMFSFRDRSELEAVECWNDRRVKGLMGDALSGACGYHSLAVASNTDPLEVESPAPTHHVRPFFQSASPNERPVNPARIHCILRSLMLMALCSSPIAVVGPFLQKSTANYRSQETPEVLSAKCSNAQHRLYQTAPGH